MPKAMTMEITPDLMTRIGRLRANIRDGNPPPEVAYVKKRLADAIRNAEQIQILFGGIIDQSAVDEAVFWKMELDAAYLRATQSL